MRDTRVWRRGVAVVNYDRVPETFDYATYLPAQFLRDAGFEVHLVARGPERTQRELEGIQCWVETGAAAVTRRVLGFRAELVYVEATAYGVMYGRVGRRSWHRNPPYAKRPAVVRVQQQAIRLFDAVTITNPAQRSMWKLRRGQLTELPYPVDLGFWSAIPARTTAWWDDRAIPPPSGPVLVYVANLLRRKRQIEMVRWLGPLLRERRDVTVVFVGAPFEPGVLEEIERARLEEDVVAQVHAPGGMGRKAIRELFAWSTLSVINTASETQCMALYECFAAGVPAVMTDIPELTSQFPYVPAHTTAEELRHNVTSLLDDPAARGALVERAQPDLAAADRVRHDELLAATVERLVGRSLK